MRVLSADDVRRAVSMTDAVDAVEQAFVALSTGNATVPLRAHVATPEHEATSFFMPARLATPVQTALGLKVVSVFPHNSARGEPSIHALVALFDPATGQPLAVVDGTYLTALRTGASSGVATRHMARPDARVLALFGAGSQALHQALAVMAVRPIERVHLLNRTRERAQALAERLLAAGFDGEVMVASGAEEALSQADVVCTATSAPVPLFRDEWLRPGTHLNAVGAYTPAMAELPAATVGRARVIVDQRAAAWAEAGDLIQARDAGLFDETGVAGEIGEVAVGLVAGRTTPEQITLFKSVGNAAQDLAVAALALQRAVESGQGTIVPW